MAFKQQYKGLSKTSDGKGFTLSELEEKTKKEKIKSKKQALELTQIEGLGNNDYGDQEDRKFAGDDGYDTLKNSMDKPKKKK